MKIAVDVMGTDYGPKELVLGAVNAVKEYGCETVLVGDEKIIRELLVKYGADKNPKITIHHASEVIAMDEHPAIAVKSKKDASIVVAAGLLRNNECDALVSSGSTGAAVASALFCVGRIRGVERPAIATPIPSLKGTTVVLDSGAKVDAKPEHMVQSAIMGTVYAEKILKISQPKVGLLNIGEEDTKGSPLVTEANKVLQNQSIIPFSGNAEGRDIMTGEFDVVVTDGFTGNVVLKFGEGAGKLVKTLLKDAVTKGGIRAKIGALLLAPALKKYLAKPMDYAEYGGAPLLGINGGLIICHGASKAKAIKNAIRMAEDVCKENLDKVVTETLAQLNESTKAESEEEKSVTDKEI